MPIDPNVRRTPILNAYREAGHGEGPDGHVKRTEKLQKRTQTDLPPNLLHILLQPGAAGRHRHGRASRIGARSRLRIGACLLSVLAAAAASRAWTQTPASPPAGAAAAAQDETPEAERTREFLGLGRKPDPAAAARGEKTFSSNCAFCHGADARGGEGPDLLRSQVVLDDDMGEKIGPVIQNGRPNLGMPAFPSFDAAQIRDIAEFLHMQIELAANRGTYQELNIVTGNAKAGQAFFNGAGQCNTCHSTAGDLAHIGAKLAPPVLQRAFLYPPTAGFQPPVRAVVTLADGKTVSGTAKHLDDFYIALYDDQGAFHSIPLGPGIKVVLHDGLEFHRRMLGQYTDAEMHDLTAYLVTLR